jgi:hypothetical protein
MSEHITKSVVFVFNALGIFVWLTLVIAGVFVFWFDQPTTTWIWIGVAVFIALIAIWIGYIILGTAFFGALGLFVVASEQKFVGIAVYTACWFILFPAMVIASLAFGIYCREYKVLIPRDLRWIFNKPKGTRLVPNEDGIVKVALPSGESFEVSGSDWYFFHPTKEQVNNHLESDTNPVIIKHKTSLSNKLRSVDFYYLKRRRDISPDTFIFLTALGKINSEPRPIDDESVAEWVDDNVGLGKGIQMYWSRQAVEPMADGVVQAFKTRTKKMSILDNDPGHFTEYFNLATVTLTDWIISLECDGIDALPSLRKAHTQIYESFRL